MRRGLKNIIIKGESTIFRKLGIIFDEVTKGFREYRLVIRIVGEYRREN